jgi:hypothetical protein
MKGGDKMSVDLQATKAKLISSGRTIAGWARTKGIDPEHMRGVFYENGRAQITDEDIKALDEDGLLVKKAKKGR